MTRAPNPWALAGITAVVFLAFRLPLLHAVSLISATETLNFGLLPLHLRDGLLAPIGAYLPQAQEGGGLPFGCLCALPYAVAGPTMETLRWCNLAWHLGMAIAAAMLAARVAGWRGAMVATVLFAAAPPLLIHYGHKGWSSHMDAGLPVLLALLVASSPRAVEAGRRGLLTVGGAAILVGIAGFVLLDGLFAGAGVLLVLIARRGRGHLLPRAGAAALGFALTVPLYGMGGWPWGSGPVRSALAAEPSALLSRVVTEIVPGLARFWAFDVPPVLHSVLPGRPDRTLGAIFFLGLLGVGLWALRRRGPIVSSVLLGAAIHLAAFSLSGAGADYGGYYAPLFVLLVVAASAVPHPAPIAVRAAQAGLMLLAIACWATQLQTEMRRLANPAEDAGRALTSSIAGHRLPDHPVSQRLRGLADDAYVAMARTHASETHWIEWLRGRAAQRRWAEAGAGADLSERSPWFWEGVGAEWMLGPLGVAHERPNAQAIEMGGARMEGLEALGQRSPEVDRTIRLGAVWGLLRQTRPAPEELTPPIAEDAAAMVCESMGRTAWTYRQTDHADRWQARDPRCTDAAIARGVGVAMARDLADAEAGEAVDLAIGGWWHQRGADVTFIAAVHAAFDGERARLRRARGWAAAEPSRVGVLGR